MNDCKHDEFTDTCGTCWFNKGMAETNYEKRINCFNVAQIIYQTRIDTFDDIQEIINHPNHKE
jgi:hypothetical protein